MHSTCAVIRLDPFCDFSAAELRDLVTIQCVHNACARLCGFSILEHLQFIRQQCVGSILQQFLPERPSVKLQNQHKEHLQRK